MLTERHGERKKKFTRLEVRLVYQHNPLVINTIEYNYGLDVVIISH